MSKTHILAIPFPLQGHISPLLQFAKRLSSQGLNVTLVTIHSTAAALHTTAAAATTTYNPINIEVLPDGSENLPDPGDVSNISIDDFLVRLRDSLTQNLPPLIHKLNNKSSSEYHPVKVVVYDSIMVYVLDVIQQAGLRGAAFFTQSAAVCAIYYHMHRGILKTPVDKNCSSISLPLLPLMDPKDLPSFIIDLDSYPSLVTLVSSQSLNFDKADWLLFNTFDKLELEVVNWMRSQWPIMTVGPSIPSMFLDKQLEDDKDYGMSLFKPDSESCMKWLDTKETRSVVYVSFGSLASLGEDQMEQLSEGLINSNHYYSLWVVRDSERRKLPAVFTRSKHASERILVVNWCPQLQVLAHKAVGCFVTHCGWNSTLESLSLGIPMLTIPQWTDQATNAKFIVDVFGAGIRVKVDEKGNFRREDIEMSIKDVMEGEKGDEIRKKRRQMERIS